MELKILEIVGAVAVVIIVLFIIPVLVHLRRTVGEVIYIINDARPQTMGVLKKAQGTLDGVNQELDNIDVITEETHVLIGKVGEAAEAVERAVKSPMTKAGLITAGIATSGLAVSRQLKKTGKKKKKSGKR